MGEHNSIKVICCVGFLFWLVLPTTAQILPEPLMPYDSHNTVCYGPGTHGQFRPSCPQKDTVIAVQNIKVGAKPTELDCPSSVTELTDHSGSYLVDHADISKTLNESVCCFPDEDNDCFKVYSYVNSGLEYKYHISSSGYSESLPNLEVSWEKITCSNTSEYPSDTHFMYMEYSCIERRKIGNMCSNNTFQITNSSFYLYNTDYPESVKGTVDVCQCRIQANTTNIQFYSIDMRLEKYGNYCKQSVNVTDSEGTTFWDCESAPIFNVTKVTKNQEMIVTFRNDLPVDGGHVWIAFSAEGDSTTTLTFDCNYQLKQSVIQSTTPIQGSTVKNEHESTTQGASIETVSTTFTKVSQNPYKSEVTSADTQSTVITNVISSTHKQAASTTAFSPIRESTSTAKNEHESTTKGASIWNVSTTFAKVTENLYKSDETSADTQSTFITNAISSTHKPATSTIAFSTIHESTSVSKGSSPTTPSTKSLSNQETIVIKDSRHINILYVISGTILFVLIVLLVILVIVCTRLMRKRRKMFQVDPENHGSCPGRDNIEVIEADSSYNCDINEIPTQTAAAMGTTANTQPGANSSINDDESSRTSSFECVSGQRNDHDGRQGSENEEQCNPRRHKRTGTQTLDPIQPNKSHPVEETATNRESGRNKSYMVDQENHGSSPGRDTIRETEADNSKNVDINGIPTNRPGDMGTTANTQTGNNSSKNDHQSQVFNSGATECLNNSSFLCVSGAQRRLESSKSNYRQLKRHLQRLGLRRRGVWDIDQIQAALQHELQGSGRNLGCRSMCQILRSRHGMSVGRHLILSQLRILDPDGVEGRRNHRLTRRIYYSNGPNYLVHVDGYDKIKRYGLAIHGAIDGYSRKILWLRVNRTNNDPKVVASYFLDFVTKARGTPRCLRMDAGTENGVMANMQKAFRWFHEDNMAGEKSVLIGSSPSNQRIESWWRRLHEMCIAAWQEILGELESTWIFSTANDIHIECVRFCFTQIIQKELDVIQQAWNDHQIRRQTRHDVHGKPDMLYNFPELNGTKDYLFPVDMGDVTALRSSTTSPPLTGFEEPVQRTLFELLQSVGKAPPENMEEAKSILHWLTSYFQ